MSEKKEEEIKYKKAKTKKADFEKKKTIMANTNDLQTAVLDSISDLLDKGVLVESGNGQKIDLKKKGKQLKSDEKQS